MTFIHLLIYSLEVFDNGLIEDFVGNLVILHPLQHGVTHYFIFF